MPKVPSVPFGPQSIAGYTFSFVSFVTAILALANGDHSEATVGTVVFGVASVLALILTSRNRTQQSRDLIKAAAQPRPVSTSSGTHIQTPVAFGIGPNTRPTPSAYTGDTELLAARLARIDERRARPAPWPDPTDVPERDPRPGVPAITGDEQGRLDAKIAGAGLSERVLADEENLGDPIDAPPIPDQGDGPAAEAEPGA